MQFLTAHAGQLHFQTASVMDRDVEISPARWWELGAAADRPGIHELLFDRGVGHPPPAFLAATLARGALNADDRDLARAVIWIDPGIHPGGSVYPPGLSAIGIPPRRLYLVHPRPPDLVRVATECLRCEGAAAVVTTLPQRVSRVEVRRLQLAAERGKCVGVFLREAPRGVAPDIYAAATRWLVAPAPGDRTLQRWRVQLIHGLGRNLGQSFCLEKGRASHHFHCIEADSLHPSAPLADPPPLPAIA